MRNKLHHLHCFFHDRSNKNVPHLLLDPFSHDPLLGPLNNLPCNDLFLVGQTDGRERSFQMESEPTTFGVEASTDRQTDRQTDREKRMKS